MKRLLEANTSEQLPFFAGASVRSQFVTSRGQCGGEPVSPVEHGRRSPVDVNIMLMDDSREPSASLLSPGRKILGGLAGTRREAGLGVKRGGDGSNGSNGSNGTK
jgi:hypothetical protein